MPTSIRKPFDGKRHRKSIAFVDDDGVQLVGLTKQSHKDETDINVILRNYDRTGLITHVSKAAAEYGDFTTVNEYQESLNTIIAAKENFAALPSEVRKRFGNDPGLFFEYATDPKNEDGLIKLGLAHPKAPVIEAEPAITEPAKAE